MEVWWIAAVNKTHPAAAATTKVVFFSVTFSSNRSLTENNSLVSLHSLKPCLTSAISISCGNYGLPQRMQMQRLIHVCPFLSLCSLKLECEKLASEKTEMQRHYIMVSPIWPILLLFSPHILFNLFIIFSPHTHSPHKIKEPLHCSVPFNSHLNYFIETLFCQMKTQCIQLCYVKKWDF